MEIKKAGELLKKHYLKWIMKQTGRSEEDAKMLASNWKPEQSTIDAMYEFAAQFVDDPEAMMKRNFPNATRPTIRFIMLEELNSCDIEKALDENNIKSEDIINVELVDNETNIVIWYHARITPKESEENESS